LTSRQPEGFVLIAALIFVALLALVGVVVESWVSASLDRAFRLGERVAARSTMIGAVNQIAFVATSGGYSARGLEDQPLVLLPGNIIRLKLSEPGEPLMYVVTIGLTPLARRRTASTTRSACPSPWRER
jgi:hypothetical protein